MITCKNRFDLDNTARQIMSLTILSEITITSFGEKHTYTTKNKNQTCQNASINNRKSINS